MGRIDKGVKCSVASCANMAVKSVSSDKAESSGLKVESIRNAYLCIVHYKEFKKRNKDAQRVEKWRWSTKF